MQGKTLADRRCGFTVVELLVSMSIIGILVALLIPAVQAAREVSRRITCRSHIKQLVLAANQYESIFRVYPNAGWSSQLDSFVEGGGGGALYPPFTFARQIRW